MENLSNIYGPVSRSSLIMTIQRESKQLQALERENKDLRLALEDHQNALELIMSKYRMQISQLIQLHQRDALDKKNMNDIGSRGKIIFESELIQAHSNKVLEMASVMRKAVEIDDENDCQQKMIVSQLRMENQGLREMLSVAKKNGSVSCPVIDQRTIQRRPAPNNTAEKEVQTDDVFKLNYNVSPKIDEASEVTE